MVVFWARGIPHRFCVFSDFVRRFFEFCQWCRICTNWKHLALCSLFSYLITCYLNISYTIIFNFIKFVRAKIQDPTISNKAMSHSLICCQNMGKIHALLFYLFTLQILGFDSLEIIPLLAIIILSFRKESLLQVNNLENIETILTDLSSIKILPLIQLTLSSRE